MQRIHLRAALPGLGLVLGCGFVQAAGSEAATSTPFVVPAWTIVPFLGILLSIAVCPLLSARWWEHNLGKVSAFWMLAAFLGMFLALPSGLDFFGVYGREIFTTYDEYISFIILLGSLYVISGGILIKGSLSGKPVSNLLILGAGSVLASFLGTTGAAMLLVRPLIKSIRWRRHKIHVIIFFIFLSCNIGGLLTPIGDPPLFIGFLQGVPFQWTFRLTPVWLLACGVLLALFYLIDCFLMRKEGGVPPDVGKRGIRVTGAVNLLCLLGVLAAVLFSGIVHLGELRFTYGHLEFQNILRDLGMIAFAVLSLRLTARAIRQENNFNYAPILEVAYLFIGIFTAMIPALMLLNARGAELGVNTAGKFFWAAGGLSSFLDNTPTYMTFLEIAKGVLGMNVAQILADPRGTSFLAAISTGAVFMGANTYIGNGPNFMVKSIAEQEQIRMPSFFGYMLWSGCILIPLFFLVEWIFF